jgi:hypothetical protein
MDQSTNTSNAGQNPGQGEAERAAAATATETSKLDTSSIPANSDKKGEGPQGTTTHVIEALEAAVSGLKDSNTRLRARMMEEWNVPRVAFALLLGLFGINIAGGFASQYAAYSGTSSLNESLKREITVRAEERSKAIESLEKLTTQVTTLQRDYQLSVQQANTSLKNALDAHQASDHVLFLVTLGRHHLVFQQNAKQASAYAVEAEKLLLDTQSRLGTSTDVSRSLDALWPAVLILIGESGVGTGDIHSVRRAGEKLLARNCECLEGSLFSGMALFDASIHSISDNRSILESCIASLQMARPADQDAHPATVLLVAAYLYGGKPELAITPAESFLRAFQNDHQRTMNQLTRTRVELIDDLLYIAKCQLGLPRPSNRCIHEDSWFFPAAEANLIEKVVDAVVVGRTTTTLPSDVQNQIASCGFDIVASLRRGTCGIDDSLETVRQRYGLSAPTPTDGQESEGPTPLDPQDSKTPVPAPAAP